MKLNKDYYSGAHCICCGVNIEKIWSRLLNMEVKVKFNKRYQTDGRHIRKLGADHFTDEDSINNCPMCGSSIDEDDIHCITEAVGEFNGQSAYQKFPQSMKCGECGHEEVF